MLTFQIQRLKYSRTVFVRMKYFCEKARCFSLLHLAISLFACFVHIFRCIPHVISVSSLPITYQFFHFLSPILVFQNGIPFSPIFLYFHSFLLSPLSSIVTFSSILFSDPIFFHPLFFLLLSPFDNFFLTILFVPPLDRYL